MKTHGWTIGILGVWIIITGFLPLGVMFIFWSNFITGAIIAMTAFSLSLGKPEIGFILLHFGVWMILAAFIPGFQSGSLQLWNGIVAGGVCAVLGFGSNAVEAVLPAYQVKKSSFSAN